MKKTSFTIAICIILNFATLSFSQAGTRRAIQNGNWESTSTWQHGTLPTNGDSIIIPNGKNVRITTVADYSSGAPMRLNIFGELEFQTGKKLILPTGSIITLQVAGYIIPGNGGGNSNLINIGTELVWNAATGTITGFLTFPSSALPVELIDFKARSSSNSILISWVTATEVNNDYFDVEKSRDGLHFEKISRVDGNGTSSNSIRYSYTDKNPAQGLNYYRLKQVDFDQKFEYSNSLLCKFNAGEGEMVQLFPNPTKGEFFITLREESDVDIKLVVTDSRANVVYQKQIQNIPGAKGIPVNSYENILKPGFYCVTVTINEEPFRKQLVVY